MHARYWWTLRSEWGCYGLAVAFGLALLLFGLALPPMPAAADSWDTTNASCTPTSSATYTVPSGTRYLLVDTIGGTGLYGTTDTPGNDGGHGGAGAEVTAIFPGLAGQQLKVGVGRNGGVNDSYSGRPNGSFSFASNGGGGGSSVVTTSSGDPCLGCNAEVTSPPIDFNLCQSSSYQAPAVDRNQILVLSGGGGGGGGANTFGSGGNGGNAGVNADFSGQSGSDGYKNTDADCDYGKGGGGGSATGAGGKGSGGCFGYDGTAGGTPNGFFGGQAVNQGTNPTIGAGGSGGGGWYGGGGGGSGGTLGGGGGGAGSSHVDSSALVKSIRQDTTGKPGVTIRPWVTPTTTAGLSGTTSGTDWYTTAPTVTLTAQAGEPAPIGLGHTYYALDNAACSATNLTACQTYSSPFIVSSKGLHTLTYFSLDTLGVDEAIQSHSFAVSLNGGTASNTSIGSGTNPTASSGGSTGVSASGSGSGAVSTATYSTNPAAAATFSSSNTYFDVMASGGLTSLTIKDCNLNGGTAVFWWNGTAWVAASVQTYDATTKCVTITVNSTTSPNLSQLTGTPFGGGIAQTLKVCATASSNCPAASVQAAIDAAPPGITIALQPGTNITGTLTVDRNLTISGWNSTLAGGGQGPVITVRAGATLTLTGVTVTGGVNASGNGGGISNAGTLVMSNSKITTNRAQNGGGLYNSGTVKLTNVTVSGNTASSAGGGIDNAGTATAVTRTSSSVTGNTPNNCVNVSGC